MKPNVLRNKCARMVGALLAVAALACGLLFAHGAPAAARAENANAPKGKVLYFVDAGYLVKDDGSIASRGGAAALCSIATPYMTANGLAFGDGNGNGLYNSQTDRNLYYLTPGADTYDFTQISADPVTGKYWGTYCEGTGAYGWEWWRRGKTSSATPGFETARYINENDGDQGKAADPCPLVYKFEVDDTTTPLKVTVGTRRVTDGGIGNAGNGQVQINDLTAAKIEGKDEDLTYTFQEGIYGVTETLQNTEQEKPYVTVRLGGNGRLTHVAYILIEPIPNYTNAQEFIKKGDTSITVRSSYVGVPDVTVQLTQEQQNAVAAASYLDKVEIAAEVAGENRTYAVTVVPDSTRYFINLGGKASGELLQAGAVYTEGAAHGETSATDAGTRHAGWEDDAYDTSALYGEPGTALDYRFDRLPNGAYGAIVGTFGHWSVGGRTQTISANGGAGVALVGIADKANHKTCYGDVTDGTLQVRIASKPAEETRDAYLATFILVYEVNKVTLHAQNGGESTAQYFEKGSAADLSAQTPEYADHEFNGWFTAAEGGEAVTSVTESGAVYAQWKACEYADPTWAWADDRVTATATLGCAHNGCANTKTVNATVTHTSNATCGQSGTVTHKAVIDWQGQTYADEISETADALPHTLAHAEAVAPTCEEAGAIEHWHCAVCGKNFEEQTADTEIAGEVTVAALGHDYDYENVTWQWTDFSSAQVSVACKHDGAHVQTATAELTSEVTVQPTEEQEGVRTYTATATFNGRTVTDTKTQTIPKITDPTDGDDENNGDVDGEENSAQSEKSGGGCGSHVAAQAVAVAAALMGAAGIALALRNKKKGAKQ